VRRRVCSALLLFDGKVVPLRITAIIATAAFGIYLHGMGAALSILKYPKYLNVLGIVFEFTTVLAILGACVLLVSGLTKYKPRQAVQRPDVV